MISVVFHKVNDKTAPVFPAPERFLLFTPFTVTDTHKTHAFWRTLSRVFMQNAHKNTWRY